MINRKQKDKLIEKYALRQLSESEKGMFYELYNSSKGFKAAADEERLVYAKLRYELKKKKVIRLFYNGFICFTLIGLICYIFHLRPDDNQEIDEGLEPSREHIVDTIISKDDTTYLFIVGKERAIDEQSNNSFQQIYSIEEDSLISFTYPNSLWNNNNPFRTEISEKFIERQSKLDSLQDDFILTLEMLFNSVTPIASEVDSTGNIVVDEERIKKQTFEKAERKYLNALKNMKEGKYILSNNSLTELIDIESLTEDQKRKIELAIRTANNFSEK